jgi:opacity protein-like surface antigen
MMNTKKFRNSILLTAALLAVVVGSVYAQGPNPPEDVPAYGQNGAAPANGAGYGLMHDELVSALAEATGANAEDIEARLDAGETLFEIAESYGYTVESFTELMTTVRTQVREEMISEGLMQGFGGRWASDDVSGNFGAGIGTGICLSEDGQALFEARQYGGRQMGRNGRWDN